MTGSGEFCETFFDNARAEKTDLLGKLNDGWSVGKRLLQHERASQTGGNPAANASYSDSAFVANRFRVIQRRHHL